MACLRDAAGAELGALRLGLRGPRVYSGACTLGLRCGLAPTGRRLALENRLSVASLALGCGETGGASAEFLGWAQPAAYLLEQRFDLGTAVAGAPGVYTLCWAASAAAAPVGFGALAASRDARSNMRFISRK